MARISNETKLVLGLASERMKVRVDSRLAAFPTDRTIVEPIRLRNQGFQQGVDEYNVALQSIVDELEAK